MSETASLFASNIRRRFDANDGNNRWLPVAGRPPGREMDAACGLERETIDTISNND